MKKLVLFAAVALVAISFASCKPKPAEVATDAVDSTVVAIDTVVAPVAVDTVVAPVAAKDVKAPAAKK